MPFSTGRYSSGRYPLSSHSSKSLSVKQEEVLSSLSISVIFLTSSPSLSSLVSSVSIIDTGSVFTLVFGTELEVVVTVVVAVLFILFLVPNFPFCGDFLSVVFFANVTIFYGGVFSAVVRVVSCFLLLNSSNSCFVLFSLVLAAVYFFFNFFCLFEILVHEVRETFVRYWGLCLHSVCYCSNDVMLGFYVFLIFISRTNF